MSDLQKVLERKKHERFLLQAVARMKRHQRTLWRMTECWSSDSLFSDFVAAMFFLFPAVKTTVRHTIFYNVKYLKWILTIHCTMQNMAFV